jgi:hypothetical protein
MSNYRGAALAACLGLLVACTGRANDVRVRYPSAPERATGSITIILTQPARDLTITVDGQLVAEREHTKKVTIESVPVGYVDVVIAAGGGEGRVEKYVEVLVEHGMNTTLPVASPEGSMTTALQMGLLSLAAWVISRAIYLAFL